MNRFDICEAYALYDTLWGPTPYGSRLRKIGFRAAPSLSLETASAEVKAIYGRIVRAHNRLYVAYDRYARRNPRALAWPGTRNMPRGASAWVRDAGLTAAIDCYA
jgi:hypothetical protein